ncbi:MAG: cytidylate kinase-like family protein [Bryobacteraceae bacterium]|nr:cytidylate kinase-like family protein [Bryobacteraceae bacterium]
MLAECLADRLGYRCVDRDVIVEKAAAHGVSQKELLDALQKPPSFLERFTHRKYLYLTLIQAALTEEVRGGRAVYHGNAGHLLLEGGSPILRTRIVAPLPMRVTMARERLRFSEEEALAYIHRMDDARRKWTQYLYGVDWSDPSLYDIVVNLEYISIHAACETVSSLAKAQDCYSFGPECQAAMDDLALAAQVKLRLAIEPTTQHLEFAVAARSGVASVRGKVSAMDLLPEIERVAAATPGVKEVNLDEMAPLPQA